MNPYIVAIWLFVAIWIAKKAGARSKAVRDSGGSPQGRDNPPRATALSGLVALFMTERAEGIARTTPHTDQSKGG